MDVGKRPPSHPPPPPNLSFTLVVYFFKYNRQKKKINLVDLWYASGGANKPIGFTCTKKDVLHYESTVQVLHAASAQLHSRQPVVLPVVLQPEHGAECSMWCSIVYVLEDSNEKKMRFARIIFIRREKCIFIRN